MKDSSKQPFAAFIGIDWADKKHDICEVPADSKQSHFSIISSKPEAIHEWASTLKARYPDSKVAIACELTKGPLIYALCKYEHLIIFPITPLTVKRYREAFANSGAKNDPKDALIQAEILQIHQDKLTPLNPDTPEIRALAQFVEQRRKLVQERVDLTNKITQILKCYFPQALDLFKEKDTAIFCQFLIKWPSLTDARKARKQTLLNFFNQYHARYPDVNQARIQTIKSSIELTTDAGVVDPNKFMIELLAPQLLNLINAIDALDKEIKRRFKKMDDAHIFESLPGAGPQMAPRLLAAFGSDRTRYTCASDLQKYAGVAPVTEESGQKSWTHWRYSCPKFLRQTFVEWAGQTVRYSFWARAFYEQQIAKGKHHNTALRALAFKWIRIVFRCWQTNTQYNETKYLEALKKKNSPLLKYALNN